MKNDFLENGFCYHIYNRANNYEKMFYEEENYQYFLQLMFKYLFPVCNIYAYCLMENHFHLLIRIKGENEISEENQKKTASQHFSNMFNAYTKAINKRYHRRGSLFQEHFGRKRILDEKYLIKATVYIHTNPMKHNIQNDYENYRFSSFKTLINDKETFLCKNEVLEWFGDKENFIAVHRLKNY